MPRAGLTAVLFALAALMLGGCNLVMSSTPMFTAQDAQGAPPMRPGIWVSPEGDCKFDEAQPVKSWPKCVGPALITPDKTFDATDTTSGAAYILAAGDPRVLQVETDVAGLNVAAVTGKKPAATGAAPEHQWIYFFMGLKPLAHDGAGRITKAEVWFIQCGPPSAPPAKDATPSPDSLGTSKPLPGMIMDGGACSPRDKAAVLGAAGPSRAWDLPQHKVVRWVRDGSE
jgi:hypothetical protein